MFMISLFCHKLAQNLFLWSQASSEDVDICKQQVCNRNEFSRRIYDTSVGKQGGDSEITKKTSNTSSIQRRWVAFLSP